MTTINLPADLEAPLAEAARRKGTTPEVLALDSLRMLFTPNSTVTSPQNGDTLFDFLAGYIGTVNGVAEAYSVHCGQRFADGLLEKQQRGHL